MPISLPCNNAENKILAARMESDLQDAMRESGEGLNLTEWVDENLWSYVKDTYYSNMKSVSEGSGIYALIQTTSGTGVETVDIAATTKNIKDNVRSGVLSVKAGEEALRMARLIYNQSAILPK